MKRQKLRAALRSSLRANRVMRSRLAEMMLEQAELVTNLITCNQEMATQLARLIEAIREVVPLAQEAQRAKVAADGEPFHCPHCGQGMPFGFVQCAACGKPIDWHLEGAPPPAKTADDKKETEVMPPPWTCHCGVVLKGWKDVCPVCEPRRPSRENPR
jgi:hypothetical protein